MATLSPQIEITEATSLLNEITMSEQEMTSLFAKYTFANSNIMVQFQQKLNNKTVYFICNVLRLLWSDEIVFFTIPLIMWIVQGKIGLTILFVCSYSEIVNGYLKWMIQKPRPFWVIEDLQNIGKDWASDYSFPSSHAQYSFSWSFAIIITLYTVIPSYIIFLIIVLPTCTALSRVYLGVHSFECVICGSIIGMLFACSICYIFPLLLEWFEGLPVAAGVIFVIFLTFILPYFVFFVILKLFPSPSVGIIERWTETAVRNTYSDSQLQNIDAIPLRKRQIDPRKYSTYNLPICPLFGGALGAMVLLANPSLVPGFIDKSCAVTADNLSIVMLTVLIGCCGTVVLFPFVMFIPSKLKDSGRYIASSVTQMVALVLFGFWGMVCCPYISYVTLGPRSLMKYNCNCIDNLMTFCVLSVNLHIFVIEKKK
eukprot:588095_1